MSTYYTAQGALLNALGRQRRYICTRTADSCCYITERSTTLRSNDTPTNRTKHRANTWLLSLLGALVQQVWTHTSCLESLRYLLESRWSRMTSSRARSRGGAVQWLPKHPGGAEKQGCRDRPSAGATHILPEWGWVTAELLFSLLTSGPPDAAAPSTPREECFHAPWPAPCLPKG